MKNGLIDWKDPGKIINGIAKAKTDWENIKKKTY